MSPEFKVTLDIAQMVMLGGLIWALAKMSASVDTMRVVTGDLTKGLKEIGATMEKIVTRVTVLEDRSGRRRYTDPQP